MMLVLETEAKSNRRGGRSGLTLQIEETGE